MLPYDHPLEITMRVLDGPDFDLVKYRGTPALLHMFASWCEPCAAEMPYIVSISQTYASRGLRVIGIDYREKDDTVRAYRKKFAIPFPIAMDENGGFTENLQTGTSHIRLPASLYIDSGGYLYCYTVGTSRHPGPELTYRIERFIKDASS